MARLCWTFTLCSTAGKSPHPYPNSCPTHIPHPYSHLPPPNQSQDTSNYVWMSSINVKTVHWNEVLLTPSITSFHSQGFLLTLHTGVAPWKGNQPLWFDWTGSSFTTQSHMFQEMQSQATETAGHPTLQLCSGSWVSPMAITDSAGGVHYCQVGALPSLCLAFRMPNWEKHTENRRVFFSSV